MENSSDISFNSVTTILKNALKSLDWSALVDTDNLPATLLGSLTNVGNVIRLVADHLGLDVQVPSIGNTIGSLKSVWSSFVHAHNQVSSQTAHIPNSLCQVRAIVPQNVDESVRSWLTRAANNDAVSIEAAELLQYYKAFQNTSTSPSVDMAQSILVPNRSWDIHDGYQRAQELSEFSARWISQFEGLIPDNTISARSLYCASKNSAESWLINPADGSQVFSNLPSGNTPAYIYGNDTTSFSKNYTWSVAFQLNISQVVELRGLVTNTLYATVSELDGWFGVKIVLNNDDIVDGRIELNIVCTAVSTNFYHLGGSVVGIPAQQQVNEIMYYDGNVNAKIPGSYYHQVYGKCDKTFDHSTANIYGVIAQIISSNRQEYCEMIDLFNYINIRTPLLDDNSYFGNVGDRDTFLQWLYKGPDFFLNKYGPMGSLGLSDQRKVFLTAYSFFKNGATILFSDNADIRDYFRNN